MGHQAGFRFPQRPKTGSLRLIDMGHAGVYDGLVRFVYFIILHPTH